jgi:D-glycero-alpha-D-manno-heptose-7-phosphate kinase
VHIHASAPTRIDLAGGTLDIWPLYLFHQGAQTLNAAISLRASCDLRSRNDRRLVIISEDSNQSVEADHWSQLRDNHDLRLLGRLLHHFQAEGLELTTRSDSPVGAGIAGSSALNIAVCGALNAWSGGHRTADEMFLVAMNVEAQAINVPTGAQDYRPAYYGGISAVELGVNGVRRVAIDVRPEELQQRIALAYTNASATRGSTTGTSPSGTSTATPRSSAQLARIRDIAAAMRTALERATGPKWRQIAAAWTTQDARARSTTPGIDAMPAAARKAGAIGGKVCGAGGGGCFFAFGEPDVIPLRAALAGAGARVLDFTIEARLIIETF